MQHLDECLMKLHSGDFCQLAILTRDEKSRGLTRICAFTSAGFLVAPFQHCWAFSAACRAPSFAPVPHRSPFADHWTDSEAMRSLNFSQSFFLPSLFRRCFAVRVKRVMGALVVRLRYAKLSKAVQHEEPTCQLHHIQAWAARG